MAKKSTVRASISFPTDHYETLEKLANDKKVSLAWVVRDAVEEYITNRWPLLEQNELQTNEHQSQ